MRLNNYITEINLMPPKAGRYVDSYGNIPDEIWLEFTLISRIRKFLSEMSKYKGFIWRGTKGRGLGIKYKEIIPRPERDPMDTPNLVHGWYDEYFKKKFGWKARSEGVFVVRSESKAEEYGLASIFVPVGDYRYLWSPEIEDGYLGIRNIFEAAGVQISLIGTNKMIVDTFIKELGVERTKELFMQGLNKVKYETNKLPDLRYRYHEIMFKCSRYFLLDYDWVRSGKKS